MTFNYSNGTDHSEQSGLVVFYGLNGYPITISYFIINIITAILGLWIIFLNYLVIDTMIKHRNLLFTADIFVISLAFADFFTGILLVYNILYSLLNYQNATECVFRFGLLILVSVSSGWHLLALALDRFIKITKPLHYNNVFKKLPVITLCIAIWTISLIIGLLPTMGWKKDPSTLNDNENLLCSFFGSLADGYLTMVVVLFWFPILLMLIFYLNIFKIAKRHANAIAVQENIGNTARNKFFERRSWKFTKTICIIIGTYLIMWMPTGLLIMIYLEGHLVTKTTSEMGEILLFVSSPAFLNSLLDPIIYAFKISMVKERYKQIFCCCARRVKDNEVQLFIRTPPTKTSRFFQDRTTEW